MNASAGSDQSVTIHMTSAEALVLFEWLHRHEAQNIRLDHLGIEDAAERAVLWHLSGALEKLLVEPFASNYTDLLAAARSEVRPRAE